MDIKCKSYCNITINKTDAYYNLRMEAINENTGIVKKRVFNKSRWNNKTLCLPEKRLYNK